MSMTTMSASEVADKYVKKASAAVGEYKRGINAVTEAPGKKAAAAKEKMRAKILKSIDDGVWEKKVAAVSLEEWKDKTASKGADRYPSGVVAAKGKMNKFMDRFLPHLKTVQGELKGMPDLDLEDGIARSAHQIRRNAEFKNI